MENLENSRTNKSSTKILVVDDEQVIRNMIQQYFSNCGYLCVTAADVQRALITLNSNQFDLVITDVRMPEHDGTFLLGEISKRFPQIAVIMMTGLDDMQQAVECLKIGAYDYIQKPFEMETLDIAVQRALERRNLLREREAYRNQLEAKVHERTLELVRAYDEIERTYQHTLEALVSALDLRERNTAGHSKRAVEYTRLLALQLGLRGSQLLHITRGALLHDVGKIGIPDTVLLKPSSLTSEEWSLMHKHPLFGYQMLRDIKFLRFSLDVVLYHHERYDGNGYPKELQGEEIPLGARIFAVIDAFDAITSNRVYRPAQSFDTAHKVLLENANQQFDPKVVEAFLSIPMDRIRRVYQISLLKENSNFTANDIGR